MLIVSTNSGLINFFNTRRPGDLPKPDDVGLAFEKFSVKTRDSIEIKGWLFRTASEPAKGSVILLHGIRAGKYQFLDVIPKLIKNGYNCAAIDLRAHGESGGSYCTYGYYEKYDVRAVADYLREEKGIGNKIGLWGRSLGGAIVLQAMELDSRFTFGIAQSAFADFETIAHEYVGHFLGIEIPGLAGFALKRAQDMARFDAKDVQPAVSAKNIGKPVLLIHGTKDENINIEHSRSIFSNLKRKDKKFIEVEGVGHFNVLEIGGAQLLGEIIMFMDKN